MIVEYTRYTIAPERREAFEAAYGEAAKALEESKHCQRYELTRCSEEPTRYVLRIEWDSVEGHLQGFRGSTDFRNFLGAVQPFFNDIEEMRHYEATGIAGEGGAR
ncbi:MAG: antibiotic biosynthesis monooxygenase [Gaiellaceae bacterium MAG52_C11]|nr:antibiotic biosynthesis monooxygenase [Candidatus Gaiellasilicea maunaloa]